MLHNGPSFISPDFLNSKIPQVPLTSFLRIDPVLCIVEFALSQEVCLFFLKKKDCTYFFIILPSYSCYAFWLEANRMNYTGLCKPL